MHACCEYGVCVIILAIITLFNRGIITNEVCEPTNTLRNGHNRLDQISKKVNRSVVESSNRSQAQAFVMVMSNNKQPYKAISDIGLEGFPVRGTENGPREFDKMPQAQYC